MMGRHRSLPTTRVLPDVTRVTITNKTKILDVCPIVTRCIMPTNKNVTFPFADENLAHKCAKHSTPVGDTDDRFRWARVSRIRCQSHEWF